MDCGQTWHEPHRTVSVYGNRGECITKNIMVCKHCDAANLTSVSVHDTVGDFDVWCFEEGNFLNQVSAAFHPHLACIQIDTQ